MRHIKRFIFKTAGRISGDEHLRTEISLYPSITMNILMALIQLASGITYRSLWFYSLAGYYFFLVLIRFLVLNCEVTTKEARDVIVEFKRYKLCGILLIPMNFLLAVIVFLIVLDDMGFSYSMTYTIGLTLMTLIFTGAAITNVIRYRKYNSPVLSAAKVTSLIAAFVSMLSLETALFSAFGEKENEMIRRVVTSVSGATVLVVTLVMAVYMIKHADYSIAALEEDEGNI
jgi:hypothetical protein